MKTSFQCWYEEVSRGATFMNIPEMSLEKEGEASTWISDWMSQLPPELHTVPLFNLAIPGSHDSMSYDLDINSSIIEPDTLKRFSGIYCVRKIVRKWAITQEATVTRQLDAGVRYFDLRIARKPNDADLTRLYFYHGLYTYTDVETILKEIRDWAKEHPKEILILSLSHFKGVNEHLHTHLINFIKTSFGSSLVYRSCAATLRSCWDQGRNVIVSYDYPANQHPEIWREIKYFYGDTMDPNEVESKLCHVLEKKRPSNCFFVCGLNLTLPSDNRTFKYILRPCDNLSIVELRSLPKLLLWLKQQSDKTAVNIVASDMVTHDDFVSTVVGINLKQVTCE